MKLCNSTTHTYCKNWATLWWSFMRVLRWRKVLTAVASPCPLTVIALMYWQAQGYIERLEQEIMELQKRDAELRQILDTEDNIHFLQVNKTKQALTLTGFRSFRKFTCLTGYLIYVFRNIRESYLSAPILLSAFITCAEFSHTICCTGAHGAQSADKPRVFL